MPKRTKNKAGRPAIYKRVTELQKKIDEYFKTGVKKRTVFVGSGKNKTTVDIEFPTITGLTLYLGFSDRHSFYDLEKKKEFSHTIKRARTRIEQYYEENLMGPYSTGAIFALKNFDWKDTKELSGPGGSAIPVKMYEGVDGSKFPKPN